MTPDMKPTNLTVRTMIEELERMGLSKREIGRRADIGYRAVLRASNRPYSFIPRPPVVKAISELYLSRKAELEADAAFRALSELEG